MFIVIILVAVAGLLLTSVWFGFASIVPYVRASRDLPQARREAMESRHRYQTRFGSRSDAQTFLALIGAKSSRFDVHRSSGGPFIPVSSRRDLINQEYVDSLESLVIGNITRPIARRVTASVKKRIGLWFDDLKARWREETPKPQEQLDLETELRNAFSRYNSLKSARSIRGVLIISGAIASL